MIRSREVFLATCLLGSQGADTIDTTDPHVSVVEKRLHCDCGKTIKGNLSWLEKENLTRSLIANVIDFVDLYFLDVTKC